MKLGDLKIEESVDRLMIYHDNHSELFTKWIVEKCIEEFGEEWAVDAIKTIITDQKERLRTKS